MKDIVLDSSIRLSNNAFWLKEKVKHFAKAQDGVTAIEYAVIAVAVTGVLLTVFAGDGGFIVAIKKQFTTMTDNITNITASK